MALWILKKFDSLSAQEVHDLLGLRQEVFVVEQNCIYQDVDGLDPRCFHLLCYDEGLNPSVLAGALRILPPGVKYPEWSVGRVVTKSTHRRMGFGKEAMERSLAWLQENHPHQAVRISAQEYLVRFYQSFGFKTVSPPYLEDGIPHVEMLRVKPVGQK